MKTNLCRGQVYHIEQKKGRCFICGKTTKKYLHNASNYFCLGFLCWKILDLLDDIHDVNNRLDNLIDKFKDIDKE